MRSTRLRFTLCWYEFKSLHQSVRTSIWRAVVVPRRNGHCEADNTEDLNFIWGLFHHSYPNLSLQSSSILCPHLKHDLLLLKILNSFILFPTHSLRTGFSTPRNLHYVYCFICYFFFFEGGGYLFDPYRSKRCYLFLF